MAKWKQFTIGDLCDSISITYNGNHKSVVLINTSDVLDGDVLNHSLVENKNLKGQFKKTFKKNDILYSEIRPANKRFAFVNIEDTNHYIASTKLMVLRPNLELVRPRFLFAVLKSNEVVNELQVLAETRSGTFPQITFNAELAPMKINLPDFETQDRIVSILDAIEEKINVNRNINNNLYQMLLASFNHDYFEKKDASWQKVTLDDITSKLATGLNPRKNFVLGRGENFYVTIKNMGNNRIYLDEKCDKVDDEALLKINKRSDLKVGDCLFSGIGTIGRVHFINEPITNWNISESVFTLRSADSASPEFLYLLLLNRDMQDYANTLASGSAQKGIRMADLKKYKLYLPDKVTMDSLTSYWRPLIQTIKNNEKESDYLAIIRDSILPKLMSGDIDVSKVDI